MRKGLDIHIRFSFVQAEFVRVEAEKFGVAPSDYIKFLIGQHAASRQRDIPTITAVNGGGGDSGDVVMLDNKLQFTSTHSTASSAIKRNEAVP